VKRGDFYLLVTTASWGGSFAAAKHGMLFIPPMAFGAFRYLLASLLLLSIAAMRSPTLRLAPGDWKRVVLMGVLGVGCFQTLWQNGVPLTSAANAAILANTTPLWAAFMAPFIGQKVGRRAWAGIAVSFLGVFLVINGSLTELKLGGGGLAGDLMIFFGAIFWATYTVGLVPVVQRNGALVTIAWASLVGTLTMLPFGLWQALDTDWAAVPASAWAAFLFLAVICAGLGIVWWSEGVRLLGLARGVAYSYTIPLFAILISLLFLGESFGWVQLAGAAVVLAGLRLTRGG
jgi:drug/metabolite transporter (DMT)-like permease